MSDPFIGEIRLFSMGYAPQGWAACNGQVLPISSNQALFSLLGTTYGGNGVNTFALPNMQGRVPVNMQNAGNLGAAGGEEAHTLTVNEMPAHTHQVSAGTDSPLFPASGNAWGGGAGTNYGTQPNVQMSLNAISASGQSQAHANMQPYTVLNFCIATTGIFPTRN